jgi:cellulose synthase/poly-beta-1,6-N-acetylglucosamine synthase-like glycosyltransferase
MTLTFWGLVGLILYGYFGYPATVALAGYLLDRRVDRRPIHPRVSVVVAAYNEAPSIRSRIHNILASEYPAERLELVIASDGSDDDTVVRARAVGSPRVRILDLPRRGKAAALAEGARRATGDILVFSDANTEFRADAVAMLVRNFADETVGGVVGHTGYVVAADAESTGRGENLYWRYDTWLKTLESRTGSVVSAHGGMYAIRRELFRPVEDPAVTDDFAISTAVVAQGKRLVFEPDAIGHESTMPKSGSEFRRRVRLMTRGLRGVLLRRELLNPFRHGFYAVALASRKVLRRLLPLTFPPLFAVSVALAPRAPFFAAVADAQMALLTLAVAGWALRRTGVGRFPLLYAPFFFCLANLASVVAVWNTLRGSSIERWTPHRHSHPTGARGTADPAEARAP